MAGEPNKLPWFQRPIGMVVLGLFVTVLSGLILHWIT
jgi:hypothetical protein